MRKFAKMLSGFFMNEKPVLKVMQTNYQNTHF